MKSLPLSSLEIPFRSAVTANCLFAASPSTLSTANLFSHINMKLDDIPLSGEGGLFPNIPFVNGEDIIDSGIIAGGKDLALVYLIEYELPLLERIAYESGGILIDICNYTYEDVTGYYNQGKDGWSEAILKYVISRM